MDIDLLVAHGTVITLDPARRVLDDGAVAIHRDRILAVGPHAELAGRYTARRAIDASRMAVLPGLIDTHGHGALNMIKTVGEDLGGAEWRTMADHLLFHCTTEEWWHADGLLTALERLKFGTTTGMSVLGSSPRTDRPIFGARHAEGVSRVGTRAILGAGFPRPPWPQAFSDWKNGTRVERTVTLAEVREATRELIRQWHGGAGGRVHVWVSASRFLAPSPYDPMFKPEQLEYAAVQAREMRRLADEFGVGLHTHAFGGAVRFAHQELQVLGPDVCLAHCQGIDDEELGILRDTGTTVSYCPSARRVYSYPAHCPVTELLDAGVVVAVGTDGTAPDRTFDLFKDMRMAMTLERLRFTDPWRLPPGKALEMVTIDAARALGLDRDLGSLEPGKKADLILVNLRAPHLVPGGMPVHRVVYEATGHDVETVIVDGVVLMEGRRVLSVDETAIVDFAEAEAQQAFQRAGLQPLMAIPPDFWGRSRYAARA
jgi:5-methylthioadenosine/S-adenosylhomocysteine deaminase